MYGRKGGGGAEEEEGRGMVGGSPCSSFHLLPLPFRGWPRQQKNEERKNKALVGNWKKARIACQLRYPETTVRIVKRDRLAVTNRKRLV